MAALALCDSAVAAPCGGCASCALLRSDSHPDYHVIRPEEDAKQIKVEQIRELIAALSLTSYRGGFKAAIIDGAGLWRLCWSVVVPVMRPVLESSLRPCGSLSAENFMGRSPVAAMVNKNGEPARTPKTSAPLIRGVAGGRGVRI